jgi:thioredoxin 1
MASPDIVTLTQENFDTEVKNSTSPVLVDFWAEWCGPCKMIGPVLDELAAEYKGKVKIGKVNIDDHAGLAAQFRIASIPTLLIFKKGEVVEQIVGAKPKGALRASLDKAAA